MLKISKCKKDFGWSRGIIIRWSLNGCMMSTKYDIKFVKTQCWCHDNLHPRHYTHDGHWHTNETLGLYNAPLVESDPVLLSFACESNHLKCPTFCVRPYMLLILCKWDKILSHQQANIRARNVSCLMSRGTSCHVVLLKCFA